jgi:hypothetical protein
VSPSISPAASPPSSPAAQPFAVTGGPVNLHPGQSTTLAIQNGAGPFTTSITVPLATVTVDQNARTITVSASQQTGSAAITVNDSTGAAVQIPLRVAYDAATLPQSVAVRVTGTQLDTQWLTLQIQKALQRSVQLQQGVSAQSVQIQGFTLPPALGPGASAAIPVQVHVAGGAQYFDVNGMPTVELQNVAADPFTSQVLLYDDDPEKLTAAGVLFRARVNPNAPARLYYYHENTADPRQLAVVLSSDSAQPSTVQLIDASAGPNIDVMSVGHAVSRDFLLRKPINQGIVVDVGSQSPYIADQFAMNRLDGAAGSVGIRILSGGPVTVTVLSLPPGPPPTAPMIASYLAQPQLPGDGHHRTGAFSLVNYGQQTIAFTVAGPDAPVQYGAQSPPPAAIADDPLPTGHDYGEYGVIRTLDFQIDNPLDQAQTVYLYERPMGGAVRSSFLVNGTLVQVGCARVSDRYQIGDPIDVQPRTKISLAVQTMTDGGSSYPLEVGVTSTPPSPSVPPINAPNGCFPKPQAAPTPMSSPAPATLPAPEPTG